MPIHYDPTTATFHLQAGDASYLFRLIHGKYPAHLHWGKRIRNAGGALAYKAVERASFSPNPAEEDRTLSFDTMPSEYPFYGTSDFRPPAFQVQLANGAAISEPVYAGHRILAGKPPLEGLPATYVEAEAEADTLEVELTDEAIGLTVILSYGVYRGLNVVTRSARFVNRGAHPLRLLRALSMGIDFPGRDYDMLQLSGAWARERWIERRRLASGTQSVESRRGASSHQQNPFIALLDPSASEDAGEAFGFSFVYSGSFLAHVEVDQFNATRVLMGINPFDFSWKLAPGEAFQTPEVAMVYSGEGIGGMSRTYHKLYRTRLCRGAFRDKPRPVLVNNWEATYFDFNADKIEEIARAGQELGIELFVLDDGWFGRRDDDRSSLGDWFAHPGKLPRGLTDLVERVNRLGLRFGLWFEPEMVSPDSELYRKHPDWCLHVPDRRRTTARAQLILDVSRKDVQDYIIEAVSSVLKSAPISYVKWDMNRNMTEIGSALLPPDRQRETAHRYMLGLYRVLEEITSAFPDVLFESCSGGGGRFDPGMLYYMPQTWTSDDSDAVERLKIQYGTSIVYPASSMGAHVSAVPNHQVGRVTPLAARGHVAMSGNFGYELDLAKFGNEEREAVRRQIAEYKQLRPLFQLGDMYRLKSPFEGNETAWMFVSEDRREAAAVIVRALAVPNAPIERLRLKGLAPDFDYALSGTQRVYGGDELMYVGIAEELPGGDFASVLLHFKAV